MTETNETLINTVTKVINNVLSTSVGITNYFFNNRYGSKPSLEIIPEKYKRFFGLTEIDNKLISISVGIEVFSNSNWVNLCSQISVILKAELERTFNFQKLFKVEITIIDFASLQ